MLTPTLFLEESNMSSNKKNLALAFAVAAAVASPSAFATYGYFSHGYGMKAKSMAGASTAMTSDAFGGANNPATMVWVGDRLDVGMDNFRPIRSVDRSGGNTALDAHSKSEQDQFFVPEIGYNSMLGSNSSLGITIYGNGGMNTSYPGGEAPAAGGGVSTCSGFGNTSANPNLLCGNGHLGINLSQLIVAPTWSFKFGQGQSIGVSPLLALQKFTAYGLQGFAPFSADPSKLTNNREDTSTGGGVRIGWYGKMTDVVSLGAAYSSKLNMTKLKEYKGLFADQGNFDIPENWNVGMAVKGGPSTTVALDYQRINYNGVRSVGNPSTNYGTTIPGSLGPKDGRGFGWSNVSVVKVGVEHQYSDKLTLRAGLGKGDNPIQGRDVTFNILAPAVVQKHYTAGLSYAAGKSSEVTVSAMHAARNSVTGQSLYNPFLAPGTAGTETIQMYENSLGIAWGTKW